MHMKIGGRAFARFACVLGAAVALAAMVSPCTLVAQEPASGPTPVPMSAQTRVLTVEQMEEFLLHARILKSRPIGKGVTGSRVATLSDGRLTHDAHIQSVDIEKRILRPARGPIELNYKDHYRYNIAAYRLARVLGLTNVPVSVERVVDNTHAAVTWWVDDVLIDEQERLDREKKNTLPATWQPAKTMAYLDIMRVFDELIANSDRNAGNQLWTRDGTLWLIDHTRAFRLHRTLRAPELLQRCDRDLFNALRGLTIESVTAAVDGTLTKREIEAVIARRDLIVKQLQPKGLD